MFITGHPKAKEQVLTVQASIKKDPKPLNRIAVAAATRQDFEVSRALARSGPKAYIKFRFQDIYNQKHEK